MVLCTSSFYRGCRFDTKYQSHVPNMATCDVWKTSDVNKTVFLPTMRSKEFPGMEKYKRRQWNIPVLLSPPPTIYQFSPTVTPAWPARGDGTMPCCLGFDHSIYSKNSQFAKYYLLMYGIENV